MYCLALRACMSAGSPILVCLVITDYDDDLCLLLADLKPDNIMIDLGSCWTPEAIESWVKANPPRTYASERSLNKMVTAFISQSFPLPTLDALSSHNFKLADFSNGVFEVLWCLLFL
jgi:hypothetical protein